MFTKEELESWNEVFPDCKIRETDLTQPTEAFLTRSLISYLRLLGYKVDPPFTIANDLANNSVERRLFLKKIVRNIDHILKITEKSYTFTYYDLLRPTPKKTVHMLGILLNYLYYYNMCKTEVFKTGVECSRSYQELLDKLRKSEQDTEQRRNKAEKIKANLAELSTKIPEAKSHLDASDKQRAKYVEQLEKLQKDYEDLITKIKEYEVKYENLNKRIVPEEEPMEYQRQIEEMKKEIDELNNRQQALERNLKDYKEQLKSSQEILTELEKAQEVLPAELLDNLKELGKRLKTAKKDVSTMTNRKEEILKLIKEQEEALKSLEESLHIKKDQFESEKGLWLRAIQEKESKINSKKTVLKELLNEDHNLKCKLEEEKGIHDYLQQYLTVIFDQQ